MSDEQVRATLRSDSPLVLVEAPAGCGKTYQGAEYARALTAAGTRRPMILTHTHAACSVFAARTRGAGSSIEIRTIDSLVTSIATAYHQGLYLPGDVATWARHQQEGHSKLAGLVAVLLQQHSMIARAIARRHEVIICDEHQDSSGDQHAIVMSLLRQGARVRIFADPMQRIFSNEGEPDAVPAWDWTDLASQADCSTSLQTPHRWSSGCTALGEWTLRARAALKAGRKLDLCRNVPAGVQLVFAENTSQQQYGGYQLSRQDRKAIDMLARASDSLLVLTYLTASARSLCGFFNRRIPIWEGHVRNSLERLMKHVKAAGPNPEALAHSLVSFMRAVGKGFTPSAFGDTLEQEAREHCVRKRNGKPAKLQELARLLVSEPNHRGVAKALSGIRALKASDKAFSDIEIDCCREFFDAIRIGEFDDIDLGLAELMRRRAACRPQPPRRAISTVHKAKGLECDDVIVLPCDARSFPNTDAGRCLLYVAVSRAKKRLMLVVPPSDPSPLLDLP